MFFERDVLITGYIQIPYMYPLNLLRYEGNMYSFACQVLPGDYW